METEQKKNITGFVNDSRRGIKKDLGNLAKWLVLAILIGVIVGAASILFAHVLTYVTHFREKNHWTLLGLPIAGLIIVFLYDKFGKEDGGVNQVFSTIKAKGERDLLPEAIS